MNTKHTPGPWLVGGWYGVCRKPEHAGRHPGPRGENPCVYKQEFAGWIKGISTTDGRSVVSNEYDELIISPDDAQLISAAPELLNAAYVALAIITKKHASKEGLTAALMLKEAIAKATGTDAAS